MGKDKKRFDEKLQETRTNNHDKLRYRKRLQEEQEAQQRLAEYLEKALWKNRDDDV